LTIDRSPHIDVSAVAGLTALTHLAIDVHIMHFQTLFTRLGRLQELSIKFYGTAPPTLLDLAKGCRLTKLGIAPVEATPLFPPIPKVGQLICSLFPYLNVQMMGGRVALSLLFVDAIC